MTSGPETARKNGAPLIFVVGARGVPDVEGGAEKNAEMAFPLVAASGNYRVTLVGLEGLIKSDEFRGVQLIRAPRSRFMKTDKLLYYIAAIFMAARRRPRIVHFQGLGSALFLWAYKLMGAKTVVRYGSADYLVDKWGALGKLGFLVSEFQLRFADAVIAVTPALAERLDRRGISKNVHVIANAIGGLPEGDAATAPPQPYILTVGRVTAQKNVANLLRGYSLFERKAENTPNLVVAGGLDEKEYVAGLQPLLTERTLLAGKFQRSAMGPLYRNCAVFVNASLHEGSSNAVLEAISAGCPILLSDIPENRDFGLPAHHYFDPTEPQAIADALERALRESQTFIVDPRQFLTWDEVAERMLTIYDRLAPRRGSVPASARALATTP